jgi:hypothetical protein
MRWVGRRRAGVGGHCLLGSLSCVRHLRACWQAGAAFLYEVTAAMTKCFPL